MSQLEAARATALDWIGANEARLSAFNRRIWEFAEPAWREYKSAAAYVELLRAEGFEVEAGSGEMPTAFVARWGQGGPVLASFSEYDAVPGQNQDVVPYPKPRDGLHPYAAGHTDPHSSLGTAALTGILAAKAAFAAHGIPGRLVLFGEPAEKVCGSKPVHAAKGYYDGLDAAVVYHPHLQNTVTAETQFGAYWSAVFTFECPSPESWIDKSLLPIRDVSHAAARAPGAIDALMLMYMTTKTTKEAMFPHAGAWTLNECILAGGDATSDNLAPRFTQIQYSWRASDLKIMQQITKVLENNARSAAMATHCRASIRWVTKTRVGLANTVLTEATWANLQAVGAPGYNQEALGFAREIQRNLGLTPMEEPFAPANLKLTPPEEFEAGLRRFLPEWQHHLSADDYVEFCWHCPTVRLLTARPRLKAPDPNYDYPGWTYNALGGLPSAIDPGMFVAGRTMALTLVDLAAKPGLLAAAQAEWRHRTGGGIGGSKWVPPLLPKDFVPPVDLRWPEYVTTARGEEWWVPTPLPGGGNGDPL
ncbi:amidohydrolase [Siccirubricoccus sp. KC 17139]|uniref:Amidohydrolase n=1 Tax=Siccirubricoccus soli TaxID=2899147 RepID=A0ABT1DB34_9PROT|nr:amidohydrolase [Siccirubricoccus soli]MCO6419152.1 amidohydrolase [Siccirubricoccus soli]MCP2685287.1 amidohydrolase [Siccirubricoccus soli]